MTETIVTLDSDYYSAGTLTLVLARTVSSRRRYVERHDVQNTCGKHRSPISFLWPLKPRKLPSATDRKAQKQYIGDDVRYGRAHKEPTAVYMTVGMP